MHVQLDPLLSIARIIPQGGVYGDAWLWSGAIVWADRHAIVQPVARHPTEYERDAVEGALFQCSAATVRWPPGDFIDCDAHRGVWCHVEHVAWRVRVGYFAAVARVLTPTVVEVDAAANAPSPKELDALMRKAESMGYTGVQWVRIKDGKGRTARLKARRPA